MFCCIFVLQTVLLASSGLPAAPDKAAGIDTAGQPSVPVVAGTAKSRPQPTKTSEKNFFKHLLLDQQSIWTSPAHLHPSDSAWIAPLGAVTAGLLASDADVSAELSRAPQRLSRSHQVANAGVASLMGAAGGLYLWGKIDGNAHRQETGLLAAESAINAAGVAEVLKVTTRRERPLEGDRQGRFFSAGSSFPSQHAVTAWSIASVIAHEYPGPLTKLLVYGAASAVSLSRVSGHDHFPSDVLVGSTLGWLIGRQVYRAHHDPDLPGASQWGTFSRRKDEFARDPGMVASSYVPLDSWVYPAFDRLQALGYAASGVSGLRPWTRMECARLVREAGEALRQEPVSQPEAASLYKALKTEFSPELERRYEQYEVGAEIESIYSRVSGVSGPPLDDGYHFAQTTTNDFGRPTREGGNVFSGFSSRASAGPMVFYVRGEYQHAPSFPGYSEAVRQAIAAADQNPVQGGGVVAAVNRFRLLDSYVAVNIKNFQISFGRQSLWWGPGNGGPLLLSNNAEPLDMFRISRVTPFKLPSVLGWLGPMRAEFFFARMSGHQFPAHPYIHGQKISFKPTPNLEFGFSRTVVFAGNGHPLTAGSFWRSFTSLASQTAPGSVLDVGDRRGEFDFSYRVPGLRNWLVLYADALADDDPSPLAAPRRAAFHPGIYLPRLPGLPKLDFRAEAVYTDPPVKNSNGGHFIYWNGGYHDSHTNEGTLLGSWVGREGRGLQLWSTYWLSPQSTIQIGFRKQRVSPDFLSGGDVRDFSARANLALPSDLQVSAVGQHERWAFPLLSSGAKSNRMISVELTWRPQWGIHR